MPGIYSIFSDSEYDYLLYNNFKDIIEFCRKSEFQFLDKKEMFVDIPETEYFEFKDFYYINKAVPLFSEYVFNKINELNLSESVFRKIVNINYQGVSEKYFILLPRRIRCVNYDNIESSRTNNSTIIIPELIGRFDIFKIADLSDDNIYITERLKLILEDNIDNIILQ